MTAGVISRIIAIMPALEWGWRAEFRAADIVPWISGKISGSLGCLSLSPSDLGVQGMSPRCWWMSLAVTPWAQALWEWNRMPFNSDVKDPAAACSGELGELGCRQNSLTFTEGLLESRSEGRDGFPPPIRQCSPCRWFLWGVLSTARMVGNAHRVLLARKTSLNSPVQLSCALVWAVLVNQLFLRLSILDIYCYRLDCRLDISYIH